MPVARTGVRPDWCDNAHMMRMLFFLLAGCVCLTGCQPQQHHAQAYVFGTLVEIQIDATDSAQAQAASEAVLARYQALHQQLHAWQPGELTMLNEAIHRGQAAIPVSPFLASQLQYAQTLARQSEQLFNPAIGQLVALWGFHRDQFSAVDIPQQTLDALVASQPQMRDLQIDAHQVTSHNPQVQIDLGGYAKGEALDEGARILKAHGIRHALINIGGNVIALGQHHGHPWRVGIQHPRHPGALAALDLPDGWTIGTSGDYQRFYRKNGVRYCHIIDPRSGYPATGTQSATVLIAPQAHAGILSDAASKPLFIAPSHAATLARQLGVTAWLLVDKRGHIQLNPAMQSRIQWLDSEAARHASVVP